MELWLLIIIGILALIAGSWSMKRIARIFQGSDGKFSSAEFLKMIGAGTLLASTVYMIIQEANREEAWQLFGPTYVFLVIGGFLTIIGLEKVLLTVASIFRNNKKDNETRP